MKREIEAMLKAYHRYEVARDKATAKLQSICDFGASITLIESDGHCILNEDTTDVAPLSIVNGRRKLTAEEHANNTF